eukprot:CAMPEP_0115256150 /NCGR_PEP_ID=MMETSP0270-20121206/46094_1 /TAXON_ID=71861 /ORGANISM="Scrippsiella trochoidea, Strain CCMP3099" /LENGTH=262 /DNA_ID=CAMNT_0002671787 /DNA_START=80 /DNA_END=868 /DNA_ORIENTATION=+
MCFRVFAALAIAVGGQSAVASDTRDGLCPGTGYMNLGWSGMTKDKCLERASEVHRGNAGCSVVSYSPSDGPQGSTNFCRCFSGCDGDLQHPAGEQWETIELAVAQSRLAVAPSPVPAPASGASASGVQEGLCPGTGYMNLAWSGMSKDKCLERAYQVQQDSGSCGHVSYSPSLSTNFCRCFSSCEGELLQPAGEQWETSVPQPESGGFGLVVLACTLAGVGACLVATGCAGACIWLRCRTRAAASDRANLATSTTNEVTHEV